MTNPLHDDALVAYYKKQYGVEDKPAPTTAERLKAMIQAKGEDPQYGRLTTAKAAELKRNSLKRLDSDLVVKSLSPVAANITKAFLSTGEELTPTAMTVISRKRTGITPCRRAPSCAAAARPGRWPSASAGA
ncbi:TPA: hypothetical protein ACL1TL_006650 [Pseudomonas aeruginosa]